MRYEPMEACPSDGRARDVSAAAATAMAIFAVVLSTLFPATAEAQIDARMLRYPDVSDTRIAFVYAGDIWVVPKEGGTASRLSTPEGQERFPRFSPDGDRIAFSGNYDGNVDIYSIATGGGIPRRLTHHPASDRMLDWYPEGDAILFATPMTSEKQRFNKLYRTGPEGGLPEALPVPYGEFGTLSSDGRTLAYMPITRDFRTWKRYRGGMAPDIWLFDLETFESRNVTDSDANDAHPMWDGSTLYFLSDRGEGRRYNLWALERESGGLRQVTHFTDFDVHFPAVGPSEIVFEAGGLLYLMDLTTEEVRQVDVDVVTDRSTLKPRVTEVSDLIRSSDISPTGVRAVFEARGDLFTVPAEEGIVRNLTRSSGSADRYPTWSPDGSRVAYFSDRSGEYELTVQAADGSDAPRTLTSLGAGFRYTPQWSPDSGKLAFIDQAMVLRIHDLDDGTVTQVDEGLWMYHGALRGFEVSWSPDARWMAYSRGLDNRHSAIFLHDLESGELHQATSGFYGERAPVFGPDGDYLYLLTSRHLSPSYSDFQNTWIYANSTRIAAIPLRDDVPSPLAPRNDEEPVDDEADDDQDDGDEDEGPDGQDGDGADEGSGEGTGPGAEGRTPRADGGDVGPGEDRDGEGNDDAEPVEIDLEGFERRLVVLPPAAGNYSTLRAVPGGIVYRRPPRTGAGDGPAPVLLWELESREEKELIEDADAFEVSADGTSMLVRRDGKFDIVDVAPEQKIEEPIATELETTVDPVAEWRQIFDDVWRFQRDMFYDEEMHGVDWHALGERYRSLLDAVVTRWDLNYVIGELIAELNAGHTYRGGGDLERADRRGVGLLGVDYAVEDGAVRIERIVRGAPWDDEVRSPLDAPGIDVGEGDVLLAVNGAPLDPSVDPWAAFDGLAGEVVELTVNERPTMEGARRVLVETLGWSDAARLRNLAWIDANRRRVEEATDGRVGYVYVPDTGVNGQTELLRQWAAQIHADGLIIDERFNSGGQIPDRFVELLNRPLLSWWGVRDGRDWQWPPASHLGPKVMLINGWSGSGGDAFPHYFEKQGLGPLIGTRTWGGLIGITGAPTLVDGGYVTVPTFGIYSEEGEWIIEGHGVDPDIEVVDDPTRLARGTDPQLERAIQEVLRLLEQEPPPRPRHPPSPQRQRPEPGEDDPGPAGSPPRH